MTQGAGRREDDGWSSARSPPEGGNPMAITVECEHCGKVLHVKDRLAGRRGKCPGCGHVVKVPEGERIVIKEEKEALAGDESTKEMPGVGRTEAPSGEGTGILLKAEYFPPGFFLFFCRPTVVIDGCPLKLGWGRHFLPAEPGTHTVEVFFRYLWKPRCGANSTAARVTQGLATKVSFYMWPWMFAKGAMKVEEKVRYAPPGWAGFFGRSLLHSAFVVLLPLILGALLGMRALLWVLLPVLAGLMVYDWRRMAKSRRLLRGIGAAEDLSHGRAAHAEGQEAAGGEAPPAR